MTPKKKHAIHHGCFDLPEPTTKSQNCFEISVVLTISTTLIQPMIKNAIYDPNMGEPIPKIKMAFILYMRLTEFYRIQGFVSTMISSPLLSQSHNESVRLFVEIPRISIASCTKGGLSATVLCTECEKNTHKMKRREMGKEKNKTGKKEEEWNALHCIGIVHVQLVRMFYFHFRTMSNN